MSVNAIAVTGGDSAYFPLLRELIGSLLRHPEAAALELGVLDCGLTGREAAWCEAQGATLVQPGFDVTFGAGLDPPPSFRAMTARPHLRRYFPDRDVYLWLDADVWVQDWSAVGLLIDAARDSDIAIVPELHRAYANVHDGRADFERANGAAYAQAFGKGVADRLIRRPLNNAGVFALSKRAPTWDIWARLLAAAARRSANMIDQAALNVAIYDHGLRAALLPPTCNWIAHLATPAWHEQRRLFVDPAPPHDAIGILHLTLATKWDEAVSIPLLGSGSQGKARRNGTLRSPHGLDRLA